MSKQPNSDLKLERLIHIADTLIKRIKDPFYKRHLIYTAKLKKEFESIKRDLGIV